MQLSYLCETNCKAEGKNNPRTNPRPWAVAELQRLTSSATDVYEWFIADTANIEVAVLTSCEHCFYLLTVFFFKAARLVLATLPPGSHPDTQLWGGLYWQQRLETLTNPWEGRVFLSSSSLSSLPQAKHSTCSFLLPSRKASPVWWHFQPLA